jgi:L-methionine (R)-S-oxide reductase
MERDYTHCARRLEGLSGPRHDRMRRAADILWEQLEDTGVSWIGFYLIDDSQTSMTLGPSRNSPACSPIELHGACGQAWQTRKPIIVHDIKDLGENYIACDPRDASEVVIPLFNPDGSCWGVLDADSHAVGAFDQHDADELTKLMHLAGLTHQ